MKKIICLSMLFFFAYPYNVNALAMKSIYFAASGEEFIVPFMNDSSKDNRYSVEIIETTFPNKDAKIIDSNVQGFKIKKNELYVHHGESGKFNLTYELPGNDEEKYFRIYILENEDNISNVQLKNNESKISVPVRMAGILFLKPKKTIVSYKYENRIFKNDGNVSLFLMRDLLCGKKQDVTIPVAPSSKIKLPSKQKDEIISFGQGNEILTISNSCDNNFG